MTLESMLSQMEQDEPANTRPDSDTVVSETTRVNIIAIQQIHAVETIVEMNEASIVHMGHLLDMYLFPEGYDYHAEHYQPVAKGENIDSEIVLDLCHKIARKLSAAQRLTLVQIERLADHGIAIENAPVFNQNAWYIETCVESFLPEAQSLVDSVVAENGMYSVHCRPKSTSRSMNTLRSFVQDVLLRTFQNSKRGIIVLKLIEQRSGILSYARCGVPKTDRLRRYIDRLERAGITCKGINGDHSQYEIDQQFDHMAYHSHPDGEEMFASLITTIAAFRERIQEGNPHHNTTLLTDLVRYLERQALALNADGIVNPLLASRSIGKALESKTAIFSEITSSIPSELLTREQKEWLAGLGIPVHTVN